jgi:hypothetical protein
MSWRNRAKTALAGRAPGWRSVRPVLEGICTVIYTVDPEPDSVFVITAYELTGAPLAAYRKRRKKKHQ